MVSSLSSQGTAAKASGDSGNKDDDNAGDDQDDGDNGDDGGDGKERYLLPVLNFGPTNQLMQLKQMWALARALNRTLVLTGLFKYDMELLGDDTVKVRSTNMQYMHYMHGL